MGDLADAVERELEKESGSPSHAGAGADTPKRRGRPPGSKNKPKDGAPKTEYKQGEPEAAPFDPFNFTYVKNAESVQASTMLGAVAWGIASTMLPIKPLNEEQALKLGGALDPVLARWVPVFGQWKYEAALCAVIFELWRQSTGAANSESKAEVVE